MEEQNIGDGDLGNGVTSILGPEDELQLTWLISTINAAPVGDMRVCGTCGYLKGSRDLAAEEPHVHLCDCVPQEERRAQARWESHDFNKELELCYCCGAVEIRSGSKWSPFFCSPCHRRIFRLNKLVGRCLIPIGRHSLQNGVFAPKPLDEVSVIAFADQLGGFFGAVTFIDDWCGKVALRNLVLCGYPEGADAPIDEYLGLARAHAPSPSEAFEALVRAVAVPQEASP